MNTSNHKIKCKKLLNWISELVLIQISNTTQTVRNVLVLKLDFSWFLVEYSTWLFVYQIKSLRHFLTKFLLQLKYLDFFHTWCKGVVPVDDDVLWWCLSDAVKSVGVGGGPSSSLLSWSRSRRCCSCPENSWSFPVSSSYSWKQEHY